VKRDVLSVDLMVGMLVMAMESTWVLMRVTMLAWTLV
jgi:hypothetical protein